MSLFTTINTGVSGLGANGLGLSVTGDNIANINTVGFKGSSAEFKDLLMQELGGDRGTRGMGAFTGRVRQGFGQGSIETTSNAADMAIDGKGFFQVKDELGAPFYTRAGQFTLNTDGNLVSLSGHKLQGYTASEAGNLTSTVGDVTIPTTQLLGVATDEITVTASLSGDQSFPTGVLAAPATFDAISTSASTVTTSTTIYDSLGNAHDVTLAYTKSAAGANTWEFQAFVDAGEAGGVAGTPLQISSGTLVFDTDGNLDATASTAPTGTAVTFDGAAAQTVGFDLGLATGDTGAITQRGLADIDVSEIIPNGNPPGALTGFDIGNDGMITGLYDNGQTRTLGQVALASFRGEEYLTRAGNNLWQQSVDSGEPAIGRPGEGSRGETISYALEMSNVDLEKQFVKLIQSQKGYQASTRVVSTADDLLEQLLQTL